MKPRHLQREQIDKLVLTAVQNLKPNSVDSETRLFHDAVMNSLDLMRAVRKIEEALDISWQDMENSPDMTVRRLQTAVWEKYSESSAVA